MKTTSTPVDLTPHVDEVFGPKVAPTYDAATVAIVYAGPNADGFCGRCASFGIVARIAARAEAGR